MEVDHGSYRDRLLVEKRYKFVEKMVLEVGDIRIDRDENGPFMVISDKLNHFMDQQMKKALIVKLISRTMGYQMLHNKIKNSWDPRVQAATWIRIPVLPAKYYHEPILTGIGNMVGRTIKLDLNTEISQRGQFARIVVDLDLP
ncbi:hypothetical protein Sjap_004397 [Stephania japonica]|uniref:DUF4283 domain-containing protein n=1 Tax=Stephania japonica TaxID=461633 RepID=A0AAP0K370_9MAGN